MSGAETGVRVGAGTPPGWLAVDLERPPIGDAADARLASWDAVRAPDGSATLAHGCVTAKIPGWVEDMRPPIEARTVGLAAWTAGRIAGQPIEAKPDGGDLALFGAAGGPRRGAARTFVGFEPDRVATCFVVCVGSSDHPACEASVARARLEGSTPPPAPGFALSAVSWAVYHPQTSAACGAAFVAVVAVVAVARRRKPRSRI